MKERPIGTQTNPETQSISRRASKLFKETQTRIADYLARGSKKLSKAQLVTALIIFCSLGGVYNTYLFIKVFEKRKAKSPVELPALKMPSLKLPFGIESADSTQISPHLK